MKEKFDHRLLIKQFPSDFVVFLDHLSELTYFDEPNYALLDAVFDHCMNRRAIKESDPYDWERSESGDTLDNTNQQSTVTLSSANTYVYILLLTLIKHFYCLSAFYCFIFVK